MSTADRRGVRDAIGRAGTCLTGVLLLACRPAGDPRVESGRVDPVGYPLVEPRDDPGYMPQVQTAEPPDERVRQVEPEDVATNVALALRADDVTADEPILIYAERGIVVLGGSVSTLQVEQQAMNIALSVPGVGTVLSRMEVDAPLRDDLDIVVEVQQVLEDEPAVQAPRIEVEVDDGNLRLSGIVGTEAERFLAEHVASGVDGVRSIQNQLQIATPLAQTEEQLEATIARRFEVEPELAGSAIEVDVDGRAVWLTGVVPDARAFERARWIASRAAAVREVDTTGLVIGERP